MFPEKIQRQGIGKTHFKKELSATRNEMEQVEWEQLNPEQKKQQLFLKQKDLLDTFLSHHAISRAQYDKSLGDLRVKMGITHEEG